MFINKFSFVTPCITLNAMARVLFYTVRLMMMQVTWLLASTRCMYPGRGRSSESTVSYLCLAHYQSRGGG